MVPNDGRIPYYDQVLSYGHGPSSIVPLTIGSHANQPITMTYATAHAIVRTMLKANLSAAKARLGHVCNLCTKKCAFTHEFKSFAEIFDETVFFVSFGVYHSAAHTRP